jgi:hypothetical protein
VAQTTYSTEQVEEIQKELAVAMWFLFTGAKQQVMNHGERDS